MSLGSILSGVPRHLFLLLTAGFMLMPFIWMVSLSAKPPVEVFSASFSLIPETFYGVENYREALTRAPLMTFMYNGVVVCLITLVLQILVAAPVSYALAKLQFPLKNLIFALVLIGLLVPHQVLAIPLFVAFFHLGLLNSYAALILPGIVSPFAIFLFRQFFKTVPDELISAARLDGFSEWEIIWRIMMPSAVPAIIAFSVLSVVGRWNDLFLPLVFIRSEELMTPPLGMIHFRSEEAGTSFGPLMAAAVITVLPLIVAFLIAQRRFVDGLSMSGFK
ncbi:carbohydrate ABC transporter permease [Roseibium sp. M-1]